MGYSLGFSNNGSVFLTTAMTKRRLFTTDWDYVIINDVHIFLYEKIADSNMVLKQTLLIRSENEGIDMPVSLAMYEDSFVVGLPWLSYSSFQGHAYIYKFSTSSDRYDLVADLISSEESPDDDAFGTAVALSSKQVFIGVFDVEITFLFIIEDIRKVHLRRTVGKVRSICILIYTKSRNGL